MRALRATGVESEFELPFAALHQLLRPVLSYVDRLPRRRHALGMAFGLASNAHDNRFLVSVAVLGILDELSRDSPVLCVIDDAQWLDEASASALEFVARRIDADRIALLFAARDGDVRRFSAPWTAGAARRRAGSEAGGQLLAERVGVAIPSEVLNRLMEATGGNPLALVELPALITPDQFSRSGTVAVAAADDRCCPAHFCATGPPPPRVDATAVAGGGRRRDVSPGHSAGGGGKLGVPAAARPAERAEL